MVVFINDDKNISFRQEENKVIYRRFHALWSNRDYLLLWGGQFVSAFGSQISAFAIPLFILGLTHSPAQAGLVGALGTLPFLLLSLPAGALIDRWDQKWVMVLCNCALAGIFGSVVIAFAFGRLTVLHLALVVVLGSIFTTFLSISQITSLPKMVQSEHLSQAVAQNYGIRASSELLGPVLGGLCYGIGNIFPFLVDTISYIAFVCMLCFIQTPLKGIRSSPSQDLKTEILEGMIWLWHHPVLRFMTILTWGLMAPCFGYTLVLLVLAQQLHASSFLIGLVLASGGIGSVLGTMLAGPLMKRFCLGQIILGTMWPWVLSWLPLAVAPNLLLLGIANAIGFIVVPIYLIAQSSYQLSLVPDQLQGRVNSVIGLIVFGGQPLSLGLTGLLLQEIGPRATVLVLFVPQLILAIVTMFNRRIRSL